MGVVPETLDETKQLVLERTKHNLEKPDIDSRKEAVHLALLQTLISFEDYQLWKIYAVSRSEFDGASTHKGYVPSDKTEPYYVINKLFDDLYEYLYQYAMNESS